MDSTKSRMFALLHGGIFRRVDKGFACAALIFIAAFSSLTIGTVTVHARSQKRNPSSPQQQTLSATKAGQSPAPQQVTYAQASSGQYNNSLVSISGVLVSQLRDADSSTVIIKAGGHLVSGRLEQKNLIEQYEIGSQVQISGFCRVIPTAFQSAYLSHLEMRSPADVKLIAKPSWFTFRHFLFFLLALGVMALTVAVWVAFLRWRKVNRLAWIDRSMIVARERSRILEMISSNRTLDELLQEICKSIMDLLPGADCRYQLHPEQALLKLEAGGSPVSPNGKSSFEVALRDEAGRVNGKIIVSCANVQSLSSDREEIFTLLSELASLAMRQSLLYRSLVYHSTHDPLTELPNRRLCESQLANAIGEAERKSGQLAVIYIDINRFKYVNDQYGHRIGDLYLQQISVRLRSQLRPIDMLARIGGDEFVVIAPFPEAYDRAYALTTRLEKCFDEPFVLDGHSVEGSASLGFARYPEHGTTADELTRHADHAMYISKHEARISESAHGIAIITPDELELALLMGRFRLAYQPQFSAVGRLTGMETLLRLDDPVLGIITPDAFISVAERHPVIVDIGAWALRTALSDATRWSLNTGEPVSLAVNVSVRQLEEPGYSSFVLACLKEAKFPPERLEIELVERSLVFSGDKVTHQLERLRDAGVRISLDDFGTEQSCLSLLHKLPIDTIKLDRSFIRAMDGEPGVLPIIQAIVSMAHSLGKRVVAEAIEHDGPVPALMKMGKMDFQGFLLSRPIPAEEMNIHLPRWRSGIVMPQAFAATGR